MLIGSNSTLWGYWGWRIKPRNLFTCSLRSTATMHKRSEVRSSVSATNRAIFQVQGYSRTRKGCLSSSIATFIRLWELSMERKDEQLTYHSTLMQTLLTLLTISTLYPCLPGASMLRLMNQSSSNLMD